MGIQEAVLTCKAEELDQFKGTTYVQANLATAKCQVSDSKLQSNMRSLLPPEEKISACQERRNTYQLLTTELQTGIRPKITVKTVLYRVNEYIQVMIDHCRFQMTWTSCENVIKHSNKYRAIEQ